MSQTSQRQTRSNVALKPKLSMTPMGGNNSEQTHELGKGISTQKKYTSKEKQQPINPQFNLHTNPILKQLQTYDLQIKELLQERDIHQKTIQMLIEEKSKRNKKGVRKSRKIKNHFDLITKRIAKTKLFRLVKFVHKPEEMENCTVPGTIGYTFMAELRKENQLHGSEFSNAKEIQIWNNAKTLVNEAFSEKRNARQTQMKKAWKGMND